MMVDVEDVPSHGENADPYRAFEVTRCGTIAKGLLVPRMWLCRESLSGRPRQRGDNVLRQRGLAQRPNTVLHQRMRATSLAA